MALGAVMAAAHHERGAGKGAVMRLLDAFLGLFAAMTLFFAMVLLNAGVAWYGVLAPPAVGMLLLGVLAWRVRHEPKVLFVGGPELSNGHRYEGELDDAGYMVVSCPGPHRRKGGCPVLAGGTCPVRWSPQVAVVFEDAHHEGPHAPCRQGLGVPVLTLTAGSDEAFVRSDGEARMGLDRPTEETLGAIDQLARS
jgi:hypothetical protein